MNSANLKTTHQGMTLPDFKIVEQPELKIYYEYIMVYEFA